MLLSLTSQNDPPRVSTQLALSVRHSIEFHSRRMETWPTARRLYFRGASIWQPCPASSGSGHWIRDGSRLISQLSALFIRQGRSDWRAWWKALAAPVTSSSLRLLGVRLSGTGSEWDSSTFLTPPWLRHMDLSGRPMGDLLRYAELITSRKLTRLPNSWSMSCDQLLRRGPSTPMLLVRPSTMSASIAGLPVSQLDNITSVTGSCDSVLQTGAAASKSR